MICLKFETNLNELPTNGADLQIKLKAKPTSSQNNEIFDH